MKILAIETCTDACSVALLVEDECRERFEIARRRHAELILPMADALLAEAGMRITALDGIAFGRGPGAFTGVRIGTAVAQGMAMGADLPLAPVSSLAALATGCAQQGDGSGIAAAFDARMGQVYVGLFAPKNGRAVPMQPEKVCFPDEPSLAQHSSWIGIGSGWAAHREALEASLRGRVIEVRPDAQPHARDVGVLGREMLRLGGGISPETATPVYLRDRVV